MQKQSKQPQNSVHRLQACILLHYIKKTYLTPHTDLPLEDINQHNSRARSIGGRLQSSHGLAVILAQFAFLVYNKSVKFNEKKLHK